MAGGLGGLDRPLHDHQYSYERACAGRGNPAGATAELRHRVAAVGRGAGAVRRAIGHAGIGPCRPGARAVVAGRDRDHDARGRAEPPPRRDRPHLSPDRTRHRDAGEARQRRIGSRHAGLGHRVRRAHHADPDDVTSSVGITTGETIEERKVTSLSESFRLLGNVRDFGIQRCRLCHPRHQLGGPDARRRDTWPARISTASSRRSKARAAARAACGTSSRSRSIAGRNRPWPAGRRWRRDLCEDQGPGLRVRNSAPRIGRDRRAVRRRRHGESSDRRGPARLPPCRRIRALRERHQLSDLRGFRPLRRSHRG